MTINCISIDLDRYPLTHYEKHQLNTLLARLDYRVTLENKRILMDEAWHKYGCSQEVADESYGKFYSDPIWLLTGIFNEQHPESCNHRKAIASVVKSLDPEVVVDYGGGCGALARKIAESCPNSKVYICEPHPFRLAVELSKSFPKLSYIDSLSEVNCDVLVSTDVLEHVHDPLAVLSHMISALNIGGHIIIANCFYPVIACHLPSTFHFRYSFDKFCNELGLELLGPCEGSHAYIYRRAKLVEPDWARLRVLERRSKKLFLWRQWDASYLKPWRYRLRRLIQHPMYYPRRLAHKIGLRP